MNGGMSAFGTKRTWACALQMSAIGGKADIGAKGKVTLPSGLRSNCASG